MTTDEFRQFFLDNVDLMLSLGVAHPNSEKGRTIHMLLSLVEPRFDNLEARIAALEVKKTRKKKSG